jgi:hypothetical protein
MAGGYPTGRTPLHDSGGMLHGVWESFFQRVEAVLRQVEDIALLLVFADNGEMFPPVREKSGPLADIPITLGAGDVGFIYRSTDVGKHKYFWDGTAWQYDGDYPGFVEAKGVAFTVDTTRWHIMDGSSIDMADPANPGQKLTGVTIHDWTGPVVLMSGAEDTSARAATRAKWESTAITDDKVDTGTVGLGSQVVMAGVGATVPSTVGTTALSMNAHHHVLSDADAELQKFSETGGGMPDRIAALWYIRI